MKRPASDGCRSHFQEDEHERPTLQSGWPFPASGYKEVWRKSFAGESGDFCHCCCSQHPSVTQTPASLAFQHGMKTSSFLQHHTGTAEAPGFLVWTDTGFHSVAIVGTTWFILVYHHKCTQSFCSLEDPAQDRHDGDLPFFQDTNPTKTGFEWHCVYWGWALRFQKPTPSLCSVSSFR